MPRKPSKSPRPSQFSDTAIDLEKKKIAEDSAKVAAAEAKLREQMEKYQRMIEDAPRIAKERERRRREQFVNRASRTESRMASRTALPDRRYELNAGVPARERRLRAERNSGRGTFFILLLLFIGLVAWLWFTMSHGGQ